MSVPPQRTQGDAPPGEPLRLLVETGLLLARESRVEVIVQSALDAGRELCGADWGAFFHTRLSAEDTPRPPFSLTGAYAVAPEHFPLREVDDRLIEILFGNGTVRCADISVDANFGPDSPFAPLTSPPVRTRSYFAVPVRNSAGELLGGMIYGAPAAHRFHPSTQPLLETLAAQAAVAIANARLQGRLSREAAEAAEARQAQRQTADRLLQVFEATNDAVHLCDREWRITYMNSRAVDIVGFGDNLTGQVIWEAFPEAVGSTFHIKYSEVMAGKGPREFTEFYPPLGLWLSVKAYATAEGIAVFFQDVTEERRIARAKSESDRRLRQALDAAQLGTWSWDRDTDLLDLDERAAQLFLVEPHVPVSRSQLRNRIVVEDDRDITTANLRNAVETGTLYHAEYRVVSPEGVQTWISASGIPTFAEDGIEVTGMVGTLQDVTLRKTQETAIRQSEKLAATGRLAATIAHEINNPLEAITNLIFLVKTDPALPEESREMLDIADQELARVAQIAQQTLGFYRDTTFPVDIDLKVLLQSVLSLFQRRLMYKQLQLELDLAADLHVFGLQGELRQAFSNLVVNAIDASTHGRILVRGRRRVVNGVPGVSVLICDEGSGIPHAVRSRLFAPFFTTKVSVGTGLGLWVTRGILEKQGGTIRFRSRTSALTGTTFRVFLPSTMSAKPSMNPAKP